MLPIREYHLMADDRSIRLRSYSFPAFFRDFLFSMLLPEFYQFSSCKLDTLNNQSKIDYPWDIRNPVARTKIVERYLLLLQRSKERC